MAELDKMTDEQIATLAFPPAYDFDRPNNKAFRAELLKRLGARLSRGGDGWRLIETAPQDGRHILAAVFDGGVGFGGDPKQSWQDVVHYWKWSDGTHQEEWGWYPSYGPTEQALKNLTHWKPLEELAAPPADTEPPRPLPDAEVEEMLSAQLDELDGEGVLVRPDGVYDAQFERVLDRIAGNGKMTSKRLKVMLRSKPSGNQPAPSVGEGVASEIRKGVYASSSKPHRVTDERVAEIINGRASGEGVASAREFWSIWWEQEGYSNIPKFDYEINNAVSPMQACEFAEAYLAHSIPLLKKLRAAYLGTGKLTTAEMHQLDEMLGYGKVGR